MECIFCELRKKQNISQNELARRAGVSSRAIKYWESGERKMSLESAEKIANALGYDIVLQEKR